MSVASRHPEGKSEAIIKMQTRVESFPGRQYKPRRRKELSLKEWQDIADAYIVQHIPRKDVVRQFRVTEQLVSDLVCEARTKPEKMRQAKASEKMLSQKM